ncbi:hypothetical protein Fmac_014621 [Flemingia macrophylla]|uniref:Protein kinase domain-containing protein n=1 Tax=Flemingia macrophylla TaxID=520843 RepID=A0ABD1MCZ8_9FABA
MSNFDETSALSTVPPRSFSLTELEEASDNFSLHNRIGAGSKSVVYRGKLCDGGEVAIRRGGACSNINIPFITESAILSRNYNAKLSDFGFATNLEEEKDGIYSDTYLDTLDGIYTGRQTKKSCVYSFGVFLLELMSGRRALDLNRPISERNLVQWARPFLPDKREIPRLMDARMAGQYSYREAKIIANLALDCLSIKEVRPNMDEVVRSLEHLQNSKDTQAIPSVQFNDKGFWRSLRCD